MSDPLGWLASVVAAREAAGLHRTLRPRGLDDDILDLAGNDYLGLSRHPTVIAAGVAALRRWGAGATGSRLVTGTTTLHVALDIALADTAGSEAALVFSSGYLANVGVVCALAGRGDLVVSDAHVHASLVDACRLSRARVLVVPHADPLAVEVALAARDEERAYVVTDAVFSVDGDLAPLADLHDICRRHGAVLVIDEAHAFGVLPPLFGPEPDVVRTATLSKALGGQGGVVLGSRAVVDHLIDTARPFIFDTGLAPAAAATALAALGVLRASPFLPERARAAATRLAEIARRHGLSAAVPDAAVTSVVVGTPDAAVRAGAMLAEHGVRVGVFRPPSVPDGRSRLRLVGRADLDPAAFARVDQAFGAL